jgi:acyl-CoA thioester hydrolase
MALVTRREVEIRWRDMDAFRHVNNAVFLTYLEAARDDFLGRLCDDEHGLWSFVIRRVELDFVSQLTQDDGAVVAEVRLERVGTSSLVTLERLVALSDGRLAAEARAVMVHLDETRRRSAPIPDDLRARILANDAAATDA